MSRPTLLLLPGLLCDHAVWTHQCAALADVADCLVPDYGLLDSITGMAEAVLAQAPAGPLAVAGHSMGGRVALEVQRLAPRRVQRLALLDTGADPRAAGAPGEQERAGRMALLALAQAQGMRVMGRQWARGMVHPAQLETPLFEEILDMIERKTPAIFEAQIHALLERPDARPVLAGIPGPLLLLCGRDDQWSPLARHEAMQQANPRARLVVIEDAGHMSTMERPAAVAQALAQWLQEPARGQGT